MLGNSSLYQISGILYLISDEEIKNNDLVIDIRFNTYGRADVIAENFISVRYDEYVVELIPRASAFKLIPSSINN